MRLFTLDSALTQSQAYKCDVTDTDLVNSTMKSINKEMGPITGLIAVRVFYPRFFFPWIISSLERRHLRGQTRP